MSDYETRETIRQRHRHLGGDAAIGRLSVHGKDVKVGAERTLTGVATTEDIDLDTEVIVQDGCDASYFMRNKTVFLDHVYDFEHSVGKVRTVNLKTDRSGKRIVARSISVMVRKGALGDEILRVAGDIGIGFSIGFNATDYGMPTDDEKAMYTKGGKAPARIVREWQWLETSFTCMPCNVSCQVDGAGQVDDSKAAALSRMVKLKAIRRGTAEMLGLPKPKTIVLV